MNEFYSSTGLEGIGWENQVMLVIRSRLAILLGDGCEYHDAMNALYTLFRWDKLPLLASRSDWGCLTNRSAAFARKLPALYPYLRFLNNSSMKNVSTWPFFAKKNFAYFVPITGSFWQLKLLGIWDPFSQNLPHFPTVFKSPTFDSPFFSNTPRMCASSDSIGTFTYIW